MSRQISYIILKRRMTNGNNLYQNNFYHWLAHFDNWMGKIIHNWKTDFVTL